MVRVVVPQVLEYVTQKATAHQLKKDLANYERKVEIGEMELRRLRTQTARGTGMTGMGGTGGLGGTGATNRMRFGGDPYAEQSKGMGMGTGF
eukprot:1709903-Rhodomonas_salina.1